MEDGFIPFIADMGHKEYGLHYEPIEYGKRIVSLESGIAWSVTGLRNAFLLEETLLLEEMLLSNITP